MDSPSSSSSRSKAIAVAAVVATGVLAYAVYFDYKRRNDVEFRRKLKKEKKRVNKAAAQSQSSEEVGLTVSPEMLREAMEAIKNEPVVPIEQREGYFMSQVSMGEQLASQGPTFHLPAAIAFFRALRIYPAPAELIGIYENTVPAPVFKLVVQMTNMDVSSSPSSPLTKPSRIVNDDIDDDSSPTRSQSSSQEWEKVTARVQGYLEVFPPKSMNVKVKSQESVAQKGARYVLVATKDFTAGETIYTEHPIVAVLDHDLQAAGTHCTNCFRTIDPSFSVNDPEASSVFLSHYCSQTCLLASLTTSNGLLFTSQSPLPEALLAGPMPDLGQGERKEAQAKFAEYVASEKRNNPLLAARFIARQVVNETSKLAAVAGAPVPNGKDYPDAEEGEYTLADHTERWRYIDVATPDQELPLLSNLLKATLPGLEAFTTESQYSTLVGKMAYNAIGVVFGEGREDRPASTARPEEVERSRTAHGTDRQVGSAIYNVSSFLTHSCSPTALVSFPSGTTQLQLTANKDLKAGDVLTIAYVDVKQREGDSMAECKRRRRVELVRGWKFACACERCEHEADQIEAAAAAAATAAVAAAPGPVIVDAASLPHVVAAASEAEVPPTSVTEVDAPAEATAADETEFPPLPEAEAEIQAPAVAEVEVEASAPVLTVEATEAAPVETTEEAFVTVEAEPVGDVDGSKVDDAVTNLEANPPASLPARGEVE